MTTKMVHAVTVRHLMQSYGKTQVLNDMNMTVPMHTIFALLGPSGGGKTTLLKCIIGRIHYKKGTVRVFGKKPGTKESGIPGALVGFMPQELALYMEFTLLELLFYFGRIFKMTKAKIKEKHAFLTNFLDLPKDARALQTFSGGQQRRASLAAALLHEPELLILDEPTVGVDPLLRQSIWKFMVNVASKGHTTIIITTHYVEEARQANVVGMLRGGRLLAEAAPDYLISKYKQQCLEDVFFQLCLKDNLSVGNSLLHIDEAVEDVLQITPCTPDENSCDLPVFRPKNVGLRVTIGKKTTLHIPWPHGFIALLVKNLRKMQRNIPFLLFQFLLPVIQMILFFGCIGHNPQSLPFGVINHDVGHGNKSFGRAFVRNIDRITFLLENYENAEDALDAVENVDIWGFVEMRRNFTASVMQRFGNNSIISNQTFQDGSIHVYMDMTNQQVALTVQIRLREALAKAFADEMVAFGLNPAILNVPMTYGKPVYGDLNPKFTDFMAPGVICIILCFMASGLTAMTFIQERKEGLLERSLVAGVGVVEIFLSHVVAQFLVLIAQDLALLIISFAAFKVPCRGSVASMVFLTLFVGFFGMCMGFLISAACDREETAVQLTVGSAYPNILLNGIIWPRSGMPPWLAKVAAIFPLTLPIDGLRSVMLRGLGIDHMTVWIGFVVVLVWIGLFVLLMFLILKLKGI